MKAIPDFSRHSPRSANAGGQPLQSNGGKQTSKQDKQPNPRQTAKPQATHAKSGRRGQ